MYPGFTSQKYALRLGLVAVAVLAVALVAGVSVASAEHKCQDEFYEGRNCETAGHNQPKPDPDELPFLDCAKNPTEWNPYEGAFQRQFIKWCEPWVDRDPTKTYPASWEVQFDGLTCDEAAAMDASVVCNYSAP